MGRLLLAVLAMFAATAAMGLGIGDTKVNFDRDYERLDAKFTSKDNKPVVYATYKKAGLYIDVIFVSARAEWIRYRHVDGSRFRQVEIDQLLEVNRQGKKWNKPMGRATLDRYELVDYWSRSDEKAAAFWYELETFIVTDGKTDAKGYLEQEL